MQNTKEFYDAFSATITQQADPFHMPVIAPPPSAEAPKPQASAFDVETTTTLARLPHAHARDGGLSLDTSLDTAPAPARAGA